MIRNIFYLITLSLILFSCGAIKESFNLSNNVKRVELGMTRQETENILGNNYESVASAVTPDGNLQTRRYSGGNCYYYFIFLEGKLVEWYKEDLPPNYNQSLPPTVTTGNGSYYDNDYNNAQRRNYNDNNSSYSRDIFNDLTYRNTATGLVISVRRDIFNDLNFSGSDNKKASLKKDIFDSHIYTDSNGNKVEFKKDAWPKELKRFENDDQMLFIYLIRRNLY